MPTNNINGSGGTLYKRQFLLQGTNLAGSPNLRHTPTLPAAPGSPSAPTFPGTLTVLEQTEVSRWLRATECLRPGILRGFTTRAAVAKVAEYVAYYADSAIIAWLAACDDARFTQRVLTRADALINNEATLSKSSDATGAGSSAPPASQTPGANTPT
jgi:hypothetical protein